MDFLISPAYSVPPMMTMRRARFTRMNVSLRVPSRFGSAFTEGTDITAMSGSKLSSSSAFGRMKRLWAKRLCQASSLTTRTFSR